MLSVEDSSPSAVWRRRLRAALWRGAPALLVALAIGLWFDQARRSCDAMARTWAKELEVDLRGGRAVLPAPALAPQEWIAAEVLRLLEADARPGVEVVFEPADPAVDSTTPSVRWLALDGALRRLRLRCDGGSIEVIGFETAAAGEGTSS